jgi:hypothetical protein
MSICSDKALSSEIGFLGPKCVGVTGATIPGYTPTGPAANGASATGTGSKGVAGRVAMPTGLGLADGVVVAAIGVVGMLI